MLSTPSNSNRVPRHTGQRRNTFSTAQSADFDSTLAVPQDSQPRRGRHSRDLTHDSRWLPILAAVKTLRTFAGFLAALIIVGCHHAEAQELVSRTKTLPRIAAGTLVEDPEAERWNKVVLLARPRIASGDVESLPASVKSTASSFVLTILATVESYTNEAGESKFKLAELGLGYSMDVDGVLKVVTVDDAASLGLHLGFFKRQMLWENEKQLQTVHVITRTSTLTIFDTPAIVLRNQAHQDYTVRHFVWIDSRTGRNAMLVWLLARGAGGRATVVDEPMRWLPPGAKEDRAIHVDKNEFSLLGIPGERAFAIEDLPPGKKVPWTERAKALAARDDLAGDSLRELTAALNEALQALRSTAQ